MSRFQASHQRGQRTATIIVPPSSTAPVLLYCDNVAKQARKGSKQSTKRTTRTNRQNQPATVSNSRDWISNGTYTGVEYSHVTCILKLLPYFNIGEHSESRSQNGRRGCSLLCILPILAKSRHISRNTSHRLFLCF